MTITQSISLSWALTFVAILSCFYLIAWGVDEWRPKRLACGGFKTYDEAFRAFKHGASWLDGNKDGTPCNSLLTKR